MRPTGKPRGSSLEREVFRRLEVSSQSVRPIWAVWTSEQSVGEIPHAGFARLLCFRLNADSVCR